MYLSLIDKKPYFRKSSPSSHLLSKSCSRISLMTAGHNSIIIKATSTDVGSKELSKVSGLSSLVDSLSTISRTNQKKSYICPVCESNWRSASALDVHKRIHTGEKPYKCLICKMGFRQKGHINKHIKAFHSGRLGGYGKFANK